MNKNIEVSCLIPIKNGIDFLPLFKANLMKVAREYDEIVLIDDHSIDQTWQFLESWRDSDDRIQLIKNPGVGLVSALNSGARIATKDWLARFDVDDSYPENRLQIQTQNLHSGLGVVFTDYRIVDTNEKTLTRLPNALFNLPILLSLYHSNRTPHPSALINKEIFNKVGGYDERDFPVEDLSLWLKIAKESELAGVPDELLVYKVHPKSISSENQELMKLRLNSIKLEIAIRVESHLNSIQWFEALQNYQFTSLGRRRSILLISDIVRVFRFKLLLTKNRKLVRLVSQSMVQNPRFISEFMRLLYERILLKKARSNPTKKS